jgi:hypothetical protein
MTSTPASDLAQHFAAVLSAASAVSTLVSDFQAVDDAGLVDLSRLAARSKQLVDAHLALVAGEIAARSSRELGHAGLAQRSGFRSAEELLKTTTGASGREAVTAVRVGRMVRDAATSGDVDPATGAVFEAAEPWLACVAAAVSSGVLSVGAADAIRTGLGQPTENVAAGSLAAAAASLVDVAAAVDVDRLLRRAREARDDLDAAGVADRERERFEKRSLKHFRLSDGMGRAVWDMDPETYAVFLELHTRATSPKRGVRFVAGPDAETAERILADPRSIGQLASDTFLGLLQAGADTDHTNMLGTGAASIRVLVPAATLHTGDGCGRIESTGDTVSAATAQRLACDGATTEVTLDTSGRPLDVGREHRTFTPRQRVALAVRDGACMFGDCSTEPAMTEAHHIVPWADGGRTDLANGILLCKFHHLLLHNNGWQIRLTGHAYWLIPPPDIDPHRTPREMHTKNPALHDLERQTRTEPEREPQLQPDLALEHQHQHQHEHAHEHDRDADRAGPAGSREGLAARQEIERRIA